jgi:hypothetical protein
MREARVVAAAAAPERLDEVHQVVGDAGEERNLGTVDDLRDNADSDEHARLAVDGLHRVLGRDYSVGPAPPVGRAYRAHVCGCVRVGAPLLGKSLKEY